MIKQLFRSLLVLIACQQFAFAANTGDMQLKSFLKSTQSFKAAFTQTLFDEKGNELQFSAGKFSLLKPGRFSWHYDEPYDQVIMSNSKVIWMFDSELEQVTIRPVDSSLSKTSMVLLFNNNNLDDDFAILKLDVINDVHWLELTSKKADAEFNHMLLGLKNNQLVSLKLIDGFGQTTEINFSNIDTLTVLNINDFEFVIPPNVDVVGGE